MPRSKREITDTGPVGQFAQRLRSTRAAAGNPTYAAMAAKAGCATTTLSGADQDHSLPTWEVLNKYLQALDITDKPALDAWRRDLDQARAALDLSLIHISEPTRPY